VERGSASAGRKKRHFRRPPRTPAEGEGELPSSRPSSSTGEGGRTHKVLLVLDEVLVGHCRVVSELSRRRLVLGLELQLVSGRGTGLEAPREVDGATEGDRRTVLAQGEPGERGGESHEDFLGDER
jgi:hypothetical protein